MSDITAEFLIENGFHKTEDTDDQFELEIMEQRTEDDYVNFDVILENGNVIAHLCVGSWINSGFLHCSNLPLNITNKQDLLNAINLFSAGVNQ